jgi:hypothetical protein
MYGGYMPFLLQYVLSLPFSLPILTHEQVLLAALVTRSPGCSLAQTALLKLDIVCTCFEHCKENVRMSTALVCA